MRIGFIVNDIDTEQTVFTTTWLAMKLHNQGHKTCYAGVGDLGYYPDGYMGARFRRAPEKTFKSTKTYLNAIQGEDAIVEKIMAPEIDVLLLRNDPAGEPEGRGWAKNAPLIFGQLAIKHGVIVLNDPNTLSEAVNKMYFQHFPEEVRPRTLISRDGEEIRTFMNDLDGDMIVKPLQGSGGKGVFLVKKEDATNLNQMVEAISRDGYIVAQEYLPEARNGDVRLIVINGEALKYKGKYAALRRINKQGDVRSNMSAGGTAERAEVDDGMLELVELVRPKLIRDGMFMVGLDIVGDKLMEINVFSPAGIYDAGKMEKVDFSIPFIEAIERKVHHKRTYGNQIDNKTIAMI